MEENCTENWYGRSFGSVLSAVSMAGVLSAGSHAKAWNKEADMAGLLSAVSMFAMLP